MRFFCLVSILSLSTALACSDDSSTPTPDQGVGQEAGVVVDHGTSPGDSGPTPPGDSGQTPPGDSGQTPADSGTTPSDSGTPTQSALPANSKVIFLHHSTGGVIWNGGVAQAISAHNSRAGKSYQITDQEFPKDSPYGWENYPYDYWNIWVEHAGSGPYMEEPTLEMLTQQYQVIVWKHCFPVSYVNEDTGNADVSSSEKTAENYKLQYAALKAKMKQFPNTRFIVWTGAALVANETNAAEAGRARTFFEWVKSSWDEPGDNIYIWDFRQLETGGGLYILPQNAEDDWDSHPNATFAAQVAPFFAKRVVDVIEGRGDGGSLTGQ